VFVNRSVVERLRPQFFTDFHEILRVAQKCGRIDALCVKETGSSFPILEVYGFRFWHFSGSGQHIFQRIDIKFPTKLKLSNADFVLSAKWDRKYKSDFRDVQIPVSVSISAFWNDYAHNSLPIFTKFLHEVQKCRRTDAYCLWGKPEVVF